MQADHEVDFHGFTAARMLQALEDIWAGRKWHGLRRVRVVHGTGSVLWRALREWCDAKGIPWAPEPSNPGATILHPSRRVLPLSHHPHRPLTRLQRYHPARRLSPQPSPPQTVERKDLMAEEFQRLAEEDPRTTRRKKYAD